MTAVRIDDAVNDLEAQWMGMNLALSGPVSNGSLCGAVSD